MSLTNINLPGFVIADLYRNSLIQPSAADHVPREASAVAQGLPKAMPEDGALPQREVAPPVTEQQPVVKEPVAEPVDITKPYVALTFVIVTQGIYPSRN